MWAMKRRKLLQIIFSTTFPALIPLKLFQNFFLAKIEHRDLQPAHQNFGYFIKLNKNQKVNEEIL